MADRKTEPDTPPTLTPTEARQGRITGRVPTIMYISIAAALVGMFLVYLAVF